MKEYSHIDTVWKRDMSNKGTIIEGDYACPEFEYLQNCKWIGTEKVDGTNIRVMWDGLTVRFGGKTDEAQIYAPLIAKLQSLFNTNNLSEKFSAAEVCLYGEGHGARIQKGGGNYNPDGVDFVLFDIKVGDWWLQRESLEDIAHYFSIGIVPIVFQGSLLDACNYTRLGIKSTWGNFNAEGLVLKPAVDLVKRNGDRIIAKIKTKDYEQLARLSKE